MLSRGIRELAERTRRSLRHRLAASPSAVMVMVMVLNSAYTGPLPRYLWCSSGAVLRSRSAVPRCLVGCS